MLGRHTGAQALGPSHNTFGAANYLARGAHGIIIVKIFARDAAKLALGHHLAILRFLYWGYHTVIKNKQASFKMLAREFFHIGMNTIL